MFRIKFIPLIAISWCVFFACKPTGQTTGGADSTTVAALDTPMAPPPPPEPQPTLSASSDPIVILSSYEGATIKCGDSLIDLAGPVRHYADSVSALGLTYNMASKNDCSGTFIRMNQWLGGMCPDYSFLSFDSVRTTKDLVNWYHEKGTLVFIQDPLQSDSLIKPGAVMFYTKSGRGGKLAINADNMVSLVNHVGVVHSVERDSTTGRITNYSLFHGRNPKRGINTTNYHKREPFGGSSKPYPYGNGQEQWMAIAPLVTN